VYLVSTGLQDSIDFLVRHCSRSEPNPLAPRQAQTSLLECAVDISPRKKLIHIMPPNTDRPINRAMVVGCGATI
jgi:hypothetical protein